MSDLLVLTREFLVIANAILGLIISWVCVSYPLILVIFDRFLPHWLVDHLLSGCLVYRRVDEHVVIDQSFLSVTQDFSQPLTLEFPLRDVHLDTTDYATQIERVLKFIDGRRGQFFFSRLSRIDFVAHPFFLLKLVNEPKSTDRTLCLIVHIDKFSYSLRNLKIIFFLFALFCAFLESLRFTSGIRT